MSSGPDKTCPTCSPPSNIIHAAAAVQRYFDQQRMTRWEFMGICSRNFADDYRKALQLTTAASVQHMAGKEAKTDDSKAAALANLLEELVAVLCCQMDVAVEHKQGLIHKLGVFKRISADRTTVTPAK